MNNDTPPAGFYFDVVIMDEHGAPLSPSGAGFQEVSGISAAMDPEQPAEGGENRFVHRVPGRAKYDDLVLKRGLLARSSALAQWCRQTFRGDLTQRISTRTIEVSLLDANFGNDSPLASWRFYNAYPTQWEIAAPDAGDDTIVVESLTFSFTYFESIG